MSSSRPLPFIFWGRVIHGAFCNPLSVRPSHLRNASLHLPPFLVLFTRRTLNGRFLNTARTTLFPFRTPPLPPASGCVRLTPNRFQLSGFFSPFGSIRISSFSILLVTPVLSSFQPAAFLRRDFPPMARTFQFLSSTLDCPLRTQGTVFNSGFLVSSTINPRNIVG